METQNPKPGRVLHSQQGKRFSKSSIPFSASVSNLYSCPLCSTHLKFIGETVSMISARLFFSTLDLPSYESWTRVIGNWFYLNLQRKLLIKIEWTFDLRWGSCFSLWRGQPNLIFFDKTNLYYLLFYYTEVVIYLPVVIAFCEVWVFIWQIDFLTE